jgi:hypothetical protein
VLELLQQVLETLVRAQRFEAAVVLVPAPLLETAVRGPLQAVERVVRQPEPREPAGIARQLGGVVA